MLIYVVCTVDAESSNANNVTKCSGDQRRKFVHEQCHKLHVMDEANPHFWSYPVTHLTPEERERYTNNLLVDDKHKLLLCHNAKVGATTYKYLLAAHSDAVRFKDDRPLISMQQIHSDAYLERFNLTCMGRLSDEEKLWRLEQYTRVMILRDPLQRIYSSYREKLTDVKPPACQAYQHGLGVKILKAVRGEENISNAEKECARSVTFPEFLEYFSSDIGKELLSDPHWSKFYPKCFPCMIDYDHYIRLETGETDQDFFLRSVLNSTRIEQFSSKNVRFNNKGRSKEEELAANNFVNLIDPYKNVSFQSFKAAKETFETDSFLFGYEQTWTPAGVTSKCRSTNDDGYTKQCC